MFVGAGLGTLCDYISRSLGADRTAFCDDIKSTIQLNMTGCEDTLFPVPAQYTDGGKCLIFSSQLQLTVRPTLTLIAGRPDTKVLSHGLHTKPFN